MLLPIRFLITFVSEYIVIALFERRRFFALALLVLGITFITHPLGAWLIFDKNVDYWIVELFIFIVELIFYYLLLKKPIKTATMYSFLANGASILVGYIFAILVR